MYFFTSHSLHSVFGADSYKIFSPPSKLEVSRGNLQRLNKSFVEKENVSLSWIRFSYSKTRCYLEEHYFRGSFFYHVLSYSIL